MTNLAHDFNWSFSSLAIYESCPYRFKLAKIDRMPEPPRPPDNPLERGNRIHAHIEKYITGEVSSMAGCEARAIGAFLPMLEHSRNLYADGKVSVEEDWLFDADWSICDRSIVWLWMKLDQNVRDESRAITIVDDWKSGKSAYKAIDHVQQMQLYAAAAAIRQPWANVIIVELGYVDEGHVKQQTYTREQALMFVGRFDLRAKRIYADKHFRPNPNRETCRYCPYSPRGTGICPVGV